MWPVAFGQLIASNRPRYGGYIVHLAVVMLAFGIVGSSFYDQERDVFMSVGDRATIGEYTVEFMDVEAETFADRTERTAILNVTRGGESLGTLNAWAGGLPVVLHDLDPGRHTLHASGRPVCHIQRTAAGRPNRSVPPAGEPHGLVDVAGGPIRHPRHRRCALAGAPARGCLRHPASSRCGTKRRSALGRPRLLAPAGYR